MFVLRAFTIFGHAHIIFRNSGNLKRFPMPLGAATGQIAAWSRWNLQRLRNGCGTEQQTIQTPLSCGYMCTNYSVYVKDMLSRCSI